MYNRYLVLFNSRYLLYAAASIIFQSCLGSIASMYILMNNKNPYFLVELFCSVSVCMTFNAAVLANLKPKIVFNLLIVSTAMNLFLLAVNLYRL